MRLFDPFHLLPLTAQYPTRQLQIVDACIYNLTVNCLYITIILITIMFAYPKHSNHWENGLLGLLNTLQ